MDEKETGLFNLIKGLKQVDANAMAAFEREMIKEVIPEIILDVEKRRMLGAESRQRQLETPTGEKPELPE